MADLPGEKEILLELNPDDPYNGRDICLNVDSSSGKHSHVTFYSRSASSCSMDVTNEDTRHYPEERHKTLLAFAFFAASMFGTTLALASVHDKVQQRAPLQDIVFNYVPQWDLGLAVSEYLIMVCIYPCALMMACHRHRWIIFRRIFLIAGVLYIGRSITMLVTAVPVANTNYFCAPKLNDTSVATIFYRAWTLTSGMGMSINGKHVFCGDYIYSGHTVTLVASYLTYKEYLPGNNRFAYGVRIFFRTCSIVGIILVSVSRGHYTIDVVIAYAVTTILFWIYHTIAANPELKSYSSNNHLSRMWFFQLILYAEQNVPSGKLPVRFEWPFPWWPKRYIAWKLELDFLE